MDTKACSRCRETKPLDQFYRKEGRPSSWCKPCTLADIKERYRRAHPPLPAWEMPTEKACNKCGEIKLIEQFHQRKSAKDGRNSICRDCNIAAAANFNKTHPEYHRMAARKWARDNPSRKADIALKGRLGVPHGTYDTMLAAQDGKCAICQTPNPGSGKTRFAVDHDEATGDVRGLLCASCNNGIGRFNHDPDRLVSAASYLGKWLLSKHSGAGSR